MPYLDRSEEFMYPGVKFENRKLHLHNDFPTRAKWQPENLMLAHNSH